MHRKMTPMSDYPKGIEKIVGHYIAVREKLKAKEEEHTKSLQPLVDLQNELTAKLQEFLSQNGVDSVKTSMGTFYSSVRYSTSLADPEAFMQYVISHEAFDLLDRRANSTAVRAYADENSGALPPGVNLSALRTIGVRRASK